MKQIPAKSVEPSDIEKNVEFDNKSGKLTKQHPTPIEILGPNDDTKIVLFELRKLAVKAKKRFFMTKLLIQAMSILMLRTILIISPLLF